MDMNQLLKEKTFKDDGLDISRRVFYTLSQQPTDTLQAHRTAKLISLLIEHLVNKQGLSETELDAMLFEAIS